MIPIPFDSTPLIDSLRNLIHGAILIRSIIVDFRTSPTFLTEPEQKYIAFRDEVDLQLNKLCIDYLLNRKELNEVVSKLIQTL
jgi:hypothetical protein